MSVRGRSFVHESIFRAGTEARSPDETEESGILAPFPVRSWIPLCSIQATFCLEVFYRLCATM